MTTAAEQFDRENLEYLRSFLGNDAIETYINYASITKKTLKDQKTYTKVEKCLMIMEKFEDNRWWKSKDQKKLAYYQLITPQYLIPLDTFIRSLRFLLGRPIWIPDIKLKRKSLIAEAEKVFKSEQDLEEES